MPSPSEYSPGDVVRYLLIQLGQGVYPSPTGRGDVWPVYKDKEAAQPDNLIKVTDTAGQDDGRTMPDGEPVAHFGFQVMVRAVDNPTGWAKANEIRTALAGVTRLVVAVDDQRYLVQAVVKIGQVLPLGEEVPVSKRNLFTLNALLSYRKL